MNITYRMTPHQADAADAILCACHQNESDKGGDGYGVDLLDTIWTERCNMVNLKPVDGIIAWTLPRWFPLEMIVEQYGPELERETDDGTFVADLYDAVAPLLRLEQDALQAALLALYTAQERYETMGFYDDDNDENDDEVAAIDMAIVAVKGVVDFEESSND
tara:strand:+ start:185 stop:670 length:486 start_codon:yes stop_codon:yes gene_type:complete